jgi:predicted AlkP superfamily pyrophosphatase or phosphodiesterase
MGKRRRVVFVVVDGMRADAFEQPASSGRARIVRHFRRAS